MDHLTDQPDPWRWQRWAFGVLTGNPTRKAVLSMLAMMADFETGRCEAKQDTLARGVEAGKSTVAGHLKALVAAGVIARREQRRYDGGRRGDEFLLLAPWVTEWPDGQPVQTPPSESEGGAETGEGPPPKNGGARTTSGNGHASGRGQSARDDEFPSELPPELHESAIAAGKILKRTALAKGQGRPVTRAAVGHAVLTYRDRDHVKVALEVEAWLLHGRGARKSCADIVSRYRNFLDGSDPRPGSAGVAPTPSAGPSSPSGNLRDMAAQLREQGL